MVVDVLVYDNDSKEQVDSYTLDDPAKVASRHDSIKVPDNGDDSYWVKKREWDYSDGDGRDVVRLMCQQKAIDPLHYDG